MMGSLLIRIALLFVTLLLAGPCPSFADTVTIPVAEDAWVWSALPANNIGATATLELGRTIPKSGQPVNSKRALLHFDITAVPTDMVVTAATLRLYVEFTYRGDPLDLGLTARRLSSPFVEGDMSSGVTWDTQPGVEGSTEDTATMNTAAGQWFEMHVADVVSAEYASSDPTNVWLQVAPSDETTIEERYVGVRSRENGSPDYVPQLVITYASPTPTFTPTPLPPPTSTATATSTPTPTESL